MAESTETPETIEPTPAGKSKMAAGAPTIDSALADASAAAEELTGAAKAKFAKALEEAKAGAQALGKQAQDTAGAYREKITDKSDALIEDAKAMGDQAKEKAASLAHDGKMKVAEGITGLSKIVTDNAGTIDEKLGVKYGDYARSAAKSMEEVAAKIEAKDLGELGDDAREAVRNSPAIAVGIAAAAGFLVARLFKGSKPESGD